MDIKETLKLLEQKETEKLFEALYGPKAAIFQKERYKEVVMGFHQEFGDKNILLFRSPGRAEISGNHTDHNHGKVLAGSIDLDCVGAAAKNMSNKVRIVSVAFNQRFSIDLNDLSPSPKKAGTADLVKGILKGFLKSGYEIGGFDAYIASNVISSAGVSSSAAFEMLLCSMINTMFNQGRIKAAAYAHIGKYAENYYWDKDSGLLDQMACAIGGLIAIDFFEPSEPKVEKIDFDFNSQDYKLILVQTGKGHGDLSKEYSAVPREMKKVAEFFGKEVCSQITEEEVIRSLQAVRKYAGDRPVLRALHFFEENKRVEREIAALKENRFEDFLENVAASGNSSWKWLQNCYVSDNCKEQGITVALALTELFIAEKGRGVCRVHGGGFAGVIMALFPGFLAEEYMNFIEKALGEGTASPMAIRPYGAICINEI